MSKEIDPQKKLLAKAAKALGLEIKYWLDGSTPMVVRREQSTGEPISWNPITNDGDCFRMMVDLDLAPTNLETWLEQNVYGAENSEEAEGKAQAVRMSMVVQAALLTREGF